MRTTVDLPSDLMQAAKVKAAQRGELLKEFLARAVVHELGARPAAHRGGRLSLPLIGRDARPAVDLTNADMEAALEAEDVERYGR